LFLESLDAGLTCLFHIRLHVKAAGTTSRQTSVFSGAFNMAEGNRSARSFGRKENPTIAFNPESELRAIERRRKADLRAERLLSRTRKTPSATAKTSDSSAKTPPTAEQVPTARRYLIAGLACAGLAVTVVGSLPQWLPYVLP
jgi:hypothetical protein